jgi:S1-C subfamily serine protease
LQFSSGLTFDDGEQILVSAQKPLGLLLEENDSPGGEKGADLCGIFVADLDASGSAGRAGVQAGDILLAVNNQDVAKASLEAVMARLAQAPRVVNLRFRRPGRRPAES